MKNFNIVILLLIVAFGCNSRNGNTTQIGENTFVHDNIVYRIIDNEITELGSLDSDSITKSMVLHPTLKNFDQYALDYVVTGAYTELTAVYRGDVLYFNLRLNGLNNLREKYTGKFTISFVDEYGFKMNNIEVGIEDFTGILGPKKEIIRYEFNSRSQMSSEMYKSIYTYSVSSSLREKSRYEW